MLAANGDTQSKPDKSLARHKNQQLLIGKKNRREQDDQ
ncbi:Uncharacterised protein [Vibrio cholerae]|nr:Uncharacterised protein [Vibrio cholerae]